jgi:hypothetical protein
MVARLRLSGTVAELAIEAVKRCIREAFSSFH